MKELVINADDFGYDPEIDRGILEAHARGLVNSATVMVLQPWATAARAAPPSLGLGLHLVLDAGDGPHEVERKLREQLARFRNLFGRPPTHLDGHRHLHLMPAALPVVARVASEQGLPVRALDHATRAALRAAGVRTPDHFLGDATLRPCWTPSRLFAALSSLPDGTAELMCHPGYAPSHARTSFGAEREIELAALCAPEARAALAASGAPLVDYARAAR